jgi:hypothetical protein
VIPRGVQAVPVSSVLGLDAPMRGCMRQVLLGGVADLSLAADFASIEKAGRC